MQTSLKQLGHGLFKIPRRTQHFHCDPIPSSLLLLIKKRKKDNLISSLSLSLSLRLICEGRRWGLIWNLSRRLHLELQARFSAQPFCTLSILVNPSSRPRSAFAVSRNTGFLSLLLLLYLHNLRALVCYGIMILSIACVYLCLA